MNQLPQTKAEIGVFGGSGFYKFLDNVTYLEVDTPFGKPSAPIAIAEQWGKRVAFLPRHGLKHQLPPHSINYRANLWALKSIGVTRIIAPSATGSLDLAVKPGEFVICDQVVDRTRGRKDTFYDGPQTYHVSFADPYCSELRSLAAEAAKKVGVTCHDRGTLVVIQGPRFSTRAESKWFSKNGWQVIGMTGYPESILARELEMCYCNISLITDYDVGFEGVKPVSVTEVVEVFNKNIERLRALLAQMIPSIPTASEQCPCARALEGARMGEG
ncbi:TPA: S-methyl-5'-thioadenosine phosphorylase [Candidatus Micrarchaeota archaeon]|nr:MAG: methylthioadenosine phosphorylase [Candidatus Micrarchaeota archaeon CG1_02_51_15]HII39041.1 S-methyl-5'-thioadenosine phosphorylase [Candidatus Micrarchaeota archaeon]